jgi:heme/copper-type cytochrome/quinol oxidase subunit 3
VGVAERRRVGVIRHPRSVDASALPTEGFGVASPTWWGTLGFMVIEGSTLVLCATAYTYLSRRSPLWPPSGTALPGLLIGTVVVAGLLASLVPAVLLHRAAKRMDRGAVLRMLLIGTVVEAILVILRAYELHALPVRWDGSAYGSAVWFTLGAHSTLLALDFCETLVFGVLLLVGPVAKRHFADVADSAMYWFFIVLTWVPLYFMLYVSPRLF